MLMPNRALLVVCLGLLACSNSHGGDAGAVSGSGGMGGSGGSGGTSAMSGSGGSGGQSGSGGVGSGGVGSNNTISLCGGVACAANETCCLLNARCFDPNLRADFCGIPSDTPPNPYGLTSCASNNDCAAGEMCHGSTCGGVGSCISRQGCGTCFTGSGPCIVCGCDGVTYVGMEAACAAGVRISSSRSACGESQTLGGAGVGGSIVTITYCGTDTQCPSGQQCCARTGECFDPAKPALCDEPPIGTRGCYTDADCYYGQCLGAGCEGPGSCVQTGSQCSSVLNPVCGCDGQTYTNAECATAEGVRIASEGNCAP